MLMQKTLIICELGVICSRMLKIPYYGTTNLIALVEGLTVSYDKT